MGTRVRRGLLFFLLVIVSLSRAQTADSTTSEIQLRTYLEKEPVPLNQEVVFHVELSWQGELNRYRVLKIGDPVLTNLKLRGSGSANRFFLDENNQPHSIKKITFYFTPLEMGMAYIDGITIQYQDMVSGQTGRLISPRIGLKIEEPVSTPGQDVQWGKMLVFALVILFLLLVAYSVFRYFQQKNQQQMLEEPAITVEEEFLQRIKEQVRQPSSIPEKKFNGLLEILRQYLRKRFELPPGADFYEIKIVLEKAGISADTVSKLEQLFQRAELVKFAGEPVNESELYFFIDSVELLLQEMNKRNI